MEAIKHRHSKASLEQGRLQSTISSLKMVGLHKKYMKKVNLLAAMSLEDSSAKGTMFFKVFK